MTAYRISRCLLIAGEPFGAELSAARVVTAIARGVAAAGLPEPDCCALELHGGEEPRALLDGLGFDARLRAAHAVIIAAARLSEQTLEQSLAFEIATRARQSGVPAYAITADDELSRFDARILDLQLILEASDTRALRVAGRKLATIS